MITASNPPAVRSLKTRTFWNPQYPRLLYGVTVRSAQIVFDQELFDGNTYRVTMFRVRSAYRHRPDRTRWVVTLVEMGGRPAGQGHAFTLNGAFRVARRLVRKDRSGRI